MICAAVQDLIDYGIKCHLITKADEFVVRNKLMDTIHLASWKDVTAKCTDNSIDDILDSIVDYACRQGIIENTVNSREDFDTKLMGLLTPMPHEIILEFQKRYKKSPKEATDWYYSYSRKLNYVRAGRIAKNLHWTYSTAYGILEIAVNCAESEGPEIIATTKKQKSFTYPKCQLCPENAGFVGTAKYPARQTLRPIPMVVGGQDWEFQYSPYGYYNEQCVVLNTKHIPMQMDETVFGKLFDTVDYLPHYFIGSSAGLPVIGGSTFTHEHLQGGRYAFPLAQASIETDIELSEYPNVKAGIVKWPMSVLRLCSESREDLEKACIYIWKSWRTYHDTAASIYSETNGVPNHTITPIARKNKGQYICDIVLRNNCSMNPGCKNSKKCRFVNDVLQKRVKKLRR